MASDRYKALMALFVEYIAQDCGDCTYGNEGTRPTLYKAAKGNHWLPEDEHDEVALQEIEQVLEMAVTERLEER